MPCSNTPEKPSSVAVKSPLHYGATFFKPEDQDLEGAAFIIGEDKIKNVMFHMGPFSVTHDITNQKSQYVLRPEDQAVFDKLMRCRFDGQEHVDPDNIVQLCETLWGEDDVELCREDSLVLRLETIYGLWSVAGKALKKIGQDETLHMFTLCERIIEPHIDVDDPKNKAEIVVKLKEQVRDGEFPFRFGPKWPSEDVGDPRQIETFLTYEKTKEVLDKAAYFYQRYGYILETLEDKVDPFVEVDAILQGNKIIGLFIVNQIKVTKDSREKGKCWVDWDKGAN